MRRASLILLLAGGFLIAGRGGRAQVAELRQDATHYNLAKTNGLPISDTVGVPLGSDGRAPGANPGPVGTANQFRGAIIFGGLVVPVSSGLSSGQSYAENADNLNLPRAKVANVNRLILQSARVGSPILSRGVSFLFGAVIPVPDVDEYGVLLKAVNNTVGRQPIEPERYWLPEPYTATDHSNRGYYWSEHAGRVFAVGAGPLQIQWRKAVASTPIGSPQDVTTVAIAGSTYTVLTKQYIVSGSPVKTPRQMYWTEGDFVRTGKRIEVPTARIGGVHIVYNSSFPERVATAFPQSSNIEPDPAKRLDEKRTLWYDQTLGSINAYNIEGRAFVELLGDLHADKTTRQHLGFEIVNVVREPTPHDVRIDLGERLTSYPGGEPDDSSLFPEPIQTASGTFAFQHNINGTDRIEFFAVHKTSNLNDLQVHWMEEGLAGLRWPFRFVRYTLDWPVEVTKYSHYVRPQVNSEADAKLTAVPLPSENAPFIQYQDPLDQVRGKLTEKFEYYTYLTPQFPAHRGLLRFVSGENIRFERVFSWLDSTLRSGTFGGTVATDLSSWDTITGRLNWPDNLVTPRVVNGTVMVGDRLSSPDGEIGSGFSEDYLAGHIVTATGNLFHPDAYQDPFVKGFDAANHGAIIPVNAIPGHKVLEVLWFRRNQVDAEKGFKKLFWPSVIARYTIEWPTDTSEIVLASNDGSGPLPSLQAKGAIYYQNNPALPGYNPNEEHALMQGGQAYALRDDLNVTTGDDYTSDPFVLLEYVESDGRPAVRLFKVLREKPEKGLTFVYKIKAGTIVQPPMPLPLLDKPFAPKVAGQPLHSVNKEVSSFAVASSSDATQNGVPFTTLAMSVAPILPPDRTMVLQTIGSSRWIYVTDVDRSAREVRGVPARSAPNVIGQWTISAQPAEVTRWKYTFEGDPSSLATLPVLIAAPQKRAEWTGTVVDVGREGEASFVVVEFNSPRPADAETATVLINPANGPVAGGFASWILASEPYPNNISDVTLLSRYADFTFQDRKGNQWVYRGPHNSGSAQPAMFSQFYYKTLPGFYFPGVPQPPTGTITPYLRALRANGTYIGDAVYGNRDGDQTGDGNSLGITYEPVWPENTPVLQMAETLTLPKRGLPAVRGQTSMEILYQQSHVVGGLSDKSVILHDPTREKQFNLGPDPASTTILGAIPDSIATSTYRGKKYFPTLPPHLAERFFLDPDRGPKGALVFRGQFVDAALGDKYLHLNVLGAADMAALKALAKIGDPKKTIWESAIDGLFTRMETFIENPGKPGTYIADVNQTVSVGPSAIAQVGNDDVAVDSYALTAVGPGTGYVTLLAGNGRAFTPEADPVSIQIVRVVSTLYRGEVNVVESSNPLNEQLTMQQVVDLAGRPEDYRFEWLIAAPVDGLPPVVYQNAARTLLSDGAWSHLPFPLPTDQPNDVQGLPARRIVTDVVSSIIPLGVIDFSSVSNDVNRFYFSVTPPHELTAGNQVVMRKQNGQEVLGTVHASTSENKVVVEVDPNQSVTITVDEMGQLYERSDTTHPESIVWRNFTVPAGNYSQIWLSLNLDDDLGARVYIDGQLLVTANEPGDNTPTTSAPAGLAPLSHVYLLSSAALAGGTANGDGSRTHRVIVAFDSQATAGASRAFNLRLEAFEAVDVTAANWLPIDPVRYEDGVRAVLGGTADVRSLSDNYIIMRYQAKNSTHASWVSDPANANVNVGWSQWTTPQLAEGWIKRVLKGINPFNQRVTDLFNNQVNTEVSLIAQAGARWEGDVALNLDSINDFGLIEIYETVLNRGKMLSIGGGINYGPANDALLLAAGYLNDLYMMLGNEAWADAANPTIGIGTKDNTYGDIATALFAFKGQLPSLLEEELALMRGRDDFLLPGVELRPLYNRLPWNFTRGIDAGEVIYSLNYNILDQNTDGKVDALDAQRMFPQGHGDAYGHYLTALKGYYALLLNKNFDWVPRIEAVTVLGKPVSVDYQDERKFAAAAGALARSGKLTFDLTWRRDFQSGSGQGWEHFSQTRGNTTTRIPPSTRYWGMDHWAARTGQGAYLNWLVGNAILPDHDPDPAHEGSIQQVDRTTVPELRELPAVMESLQAGMDSAEGGLTPLGIPATTIPFDLNPLSIANGVKTSHFEQIYERAKEVLKNAVVAFDDAKDVTRLMRSEQDSLADFRNEVAQQELAFNNQLIALYGTPYTDDIGPGKTYATGYTGPDLVHSMYIDNKELSFGSLLDPTTNYVWRIDIQSFTPNWLNSDGISDFSFIKKARISPVDGVANPDPSYLADTTKYITYNLNSHGFFQKPATWTGRRGSPGQVQQAISDIVKARNSAYAAFYEADAAKFDLDWAITAFEQKKASHEKVRGYQSSLNAADQVVATAKLANDISKAYIEGFADEVKSAGDAIAEAIPKSFIAGLAAGGDITAPVRAVIKKAAESASTIFKWANIIGSAVTLSLEYATETSRRFVEFDSIAPEEWNQELRNAVGEIRDKVYGMNNHFMAINAALQELDDAQRGYQALLAEGDRVQAEREVFRQRAAAVIQGFRTRDAAFRIFRNEKLERYKTLFDLSAQYTFMTAQAFDYETGLLGSSQGREFISRIVHSRALGVMADGEPQFGGSNTGDPGLSSVMAEMNADWSVLKGRLGMKNPDAYGTTVSLRTENYRILPSTDGDVNWVNLLNSGRKANVLEDSDVRRYCMQINPGNGLPVPGIVIEFGTTIADGLNLFGKPLAPGDHQVSAAAFATKIFAVGVSLEGYKGMDDPMANGTAISDANAASPADPSLTFLDQDAMSANPYIYLIPVGVDSMRSPPLGDGSTVRTWKVDDVAIPLPFNIGGNAFSTAQLWQSSDSLTEPLFAIRKHQPFRPVSSANVFGTLVVYWTGGELERSQYNNTRLLGRSVWNSKWKLVIPGRTLLNDPNDGLDRFVRSVKDVKLFFNTYSYSGN